MKVWSNEHVFNHSWETIVKASWRKYPNPMNTSVTGIDIIDRELVDNTLFTHRLITSQWCFPSWSKKIIGNSQYCYASEESIVDRNTRTMTMKTNNITFSDLIRVEETVIYEADPENPQTRTRMRQEATVRVQNVPFSSSIEDMLTSKIMANAMKGRQAIEWVVKKVDLEMMPDLGAISHLHTDSC